MPPANICTSSKLLSGLSSNLHASVQDLHQEKIGQLLRKKCHANCIRKRAEVILCMPLLFEFTCIFSCLLEKHGTVRIVNNCCYN